MAPGPKPKDTPKRQTLGVAVQPWTLDELDALVAQFKVLEDYMPPWFKLPTTRSSVSAWILERCASKEAGKLNLVITTCLRNIRTPQSDAAGEATEAEVREMFASTHKMMEAVGPDEFFNSVFEILLKNIAKSQRSEPREPENT